MNKTTMKVGAALILAAGLAACANDQTKQDDQTAARVAAAERAAADAQKAAADAQAAAQRAQQTADAAMQAAQQNDKKVDRAFKKSQQK